MSVQSTKTVYYVPTVITLCERVHRKPVTVNLQIKYFGHLHTINSKIMLSWTEIVRFQRKIAEK